MPRMSPKKQSESREGMEDASARIRGQRSYFQNAEKQGRMSPDRRDLLESKVGNHPRRKKSSGY